MPLADQIAAAVVNQQSQVIANAEQQTPEMVEAQTNYVDALKSLTEMLGKVNDQSQRLTRDSEEMENLNRTLTGITKVYEMQLKGASQQIGTIDQNQRTNPQDGATDRATQQGLCPNDRGNDCEYACCIACRYQRNLQQRNKSNVRSSALKYSK